NYVIASHHKKPWIKQLNILLAYLSFYNPLWFLVALCRKSKLKMKPAGMQIVGMLGVTQNIRRTFGWALRLWTGKIQRLSAPPGSAIPMRSVDGGVASHASPTTAH